MRMLDNVIDINYYAVKKARDSNLRHRPVGLGIMGFQDALYELRMPYASEAAVEFADRSMEAVCYHAYWASTELARRARPLFELSRLAVGPGHPADRLARPARQAARALAGYVDAGRHRSLRRSTGTRCASRSAATACATRTAWPSRRPRRSPTSSASVPRSSRRFGNLSVKSNLSGEFTVVNEYLVRDLKTAGPVGRGDGHGPQALRRLAAAHRPRARGAEGAATPPRSRSRRSGWSRRRRGARSGSTRRSRSTSTWPAPRARSSTRPTSWPGCVA